MNHSVLLSVSFIFVKRKKGKERKEGREKNGLVYPKSVFVLNPQKKSLFHERSK